MSGADSLIADGRALLDRERKLLLGGDYHAAESLAAEKRAYLARLESSAPALARSGMLREGLNLLAGDARRNERLLAAVRDGLAAARRRIAALDATRSGAVAYARDGSRITSRADACGRTKSA